jgi:hypothetical protein
METEMTYDFKFMQELMWSIVVAVAFAIGQILLEFDPSKITDWRLWAVSAAGGIARMVGGVLVAKFSNSKVSSS